MTLPVTGPLTMAEYSPLVDTEIANAVPDTISKAESAAGVSTTDRTFTSERVNQAAGSIKMWIVAEPNGGVENSFNVASSVDAGSGAITVTFAKDFSNVNYSTVGTAQEISGTVRIIQLDQSGVNFFVGNCKTDTGGSTDPDRWFFMAIGDISG